MIYQLGDNFSLWQYMYFSIQGILQFQIFQVPFVGADTCVDSVRLYLRECTLSLESLVTHHIIQMVTLGRRTSLLIVGCNYLRLCSRSTSQSQCSEEPISQEPYRWDSVANGFSHCDSRSVILFLPYWGMCILAGLNLGRAK